MSLYTAITLRDLSKVRSIIGDPEFEMEPYPLERAIEMGDIYIINELLNSEKIYFDPFWVEYYAAFTFSDAIYDLVTKHERFIERVNRLPTLSRWWYKLGFYRLCR